MQELHDIVSSLLDRDGTCRDLNFENPTWSGVDTLLQKLASSFRMAAASDSEGETICSLGGVAAVVRKGRCVIADLDNGSGLIQRLQVFLVSNEDGTPFVEISFFPDDIARTQRLRQDFLEWARGMRDALCARRYYARYENASWRFGDTGPSSGVFLVDAAVVSDA